MQFDGRVMFAVTFGPGLMRSVPPRGPGSPTRQPRWGGGCGWVLLTFTHANETRPLLAVQIHHQWLPNHFARSISASATHPLPRGGTDLMNQWMSDGQENNSAEDADSSNRQEAELQEGLDYYVENGLLVFTAAFLRRRGYCCESGCRHCPYGETSNQSKSED
jgi:hypothetical protein